MNIKKISELGHVNEALFDCQSENVYKKIEEQQDDFWYVRDKLVFSVSRKTDKMIKKKHHKDLDNDYPYVHFFYLFLFQEEKRDERDEK